MIDLHGHLAGILTVANDKTPRAGAKGAKRLQKLDEASMSAITA